MKSAVRARLVTIITELPKPGTDVMNKIHIFAKKLAFIAQTTASFCKHLIITLFFEKNAKFFRQKLVFCQFQYRIAVRNNFETVKIV
jgi:hypothetical protein